MSDVSPRFRELSEQIGGFSEEALNSLVFFKSPFALYHWTMNVIELLLIAGAVWGLFHAIGVLKKNRNYMNLGIWLGSVVFMLAVEIPVYFPEKIGLDPNSVLFLHNEFTAQFFYGRAPLYIMALYPALMYPAYVIIDESGLFERRWGTALGAIGVGAVHHVFYEIFDHFGPQYGWWIWNYPQFPSSLASVPVSSMVGFALLGPLSLTLMVRLMLGHHIQKRARENRPVGTPGFAVNTLIAGILTPVTLSILTPQTAIGLLLGEVTARAEMLVSFTMIALSVLLMLALIGADKRRLGSQEFRFAHQYLAFYLLVFAGLWLYALPDYFAATNGVTARGTLIGSLPYALTCFVVAGFLALRGSSLASLLNTRSANPPLGSGSH